MINRFALKKNFRRFPSSGLLRIIAQMNDYHFKVAKVQGEFVWHEHPETDEVFIMLKGQLEIQLREVSVLLDEGEMYVVPKGVEHKPVARDNVTYFWLNRQVQLYRQCRR